ncbi:hypothetical protein ACFL2G_00945 [Candidatus Omnitrophota bacterium]
MKRIKKIFFNTILLLIFALLISDARTYCSASNSRLRVPVRFTNRPDKTTKTLPGYNNTIVEEITKNVAPENDKLVSMVIIDGVSSGGKSTLAEKIQEFASQDYHILYVSSDLFVNTSSPKPSQLLVYLFDMIRGAWPGRNDAAFKLFFDLKKVTAFKKWLAASLDLLEKSPDETFTKEMELKDPAFHTAFNKTVLKTVVFELTKKTLIIIEGPIARKLFGGMSKKIKGKSICVLCKSLLIKQRIKNRLEKEGGSALERWLYATISTLSGIYDYYNKDIAEGKFDYVINTDQIKTPQLMRYNRAEQKLQTIKLQTKI